MIGAIFVGIFLSLWAFQYALLEVQTEGGVGWALAAPTWRKQSWIYGRVMNGKELTGYHLIMFFLPIYLLFGVFIFDRYWSGEWRLASWQHTVELVSWFLGMSVNWDFLWFPFNITFGLKRFRRGEIHWHRKWIGPVPADYVGALVGIALLTVILGLAFGAGEDIWLHQAVILGVLLTGTCLFALASPMLRRWQLRMRGKYGGLTPDWRKWLTREEYHRMEDLLREQELNRQDIARLGRLRAQREQIGWPDRPQQAATRT